MKKLLCAALLLLPSLGWTTYQPVTGSTVTVYPSGGSVFPVNGTVTANISGSINNTTFQATQPNAYNVVSTMTIIQASATAAVPLIGSGMNYLSLTTTGTLRTDLSTMGGITLTQTGGAQDINIKSGSIANTSFSISTGGVTAVLSGSIPAGTNALGSVTISTGGVSVKFDGTQTVSVATGGITAAQGGTWTVQPGNTANTTPWIVQVATGGVTAVLSGAVPAGTNQIGSFNLIQPGSEVVATSGAVTQSGAWNINSYQANAPTTTWNTSFPANGSAIGGISPTGQIQTFRTDASSNVMVNINAGNAITTNFLNITTATVNQAIPVTIQMSGVQGYTGLAAMQRVDQSSNTYTIPQVMVSSNTSLPVAAADKSSTTILGDNQGRPVIQFGVPTAVILTTAPSTASSGWVVLVASPAATLFTHMCGCIWNNSSATNTFGTMYPSGATTTTNFMPQGLPANDIPVGQSFNCANPFLNTTAGGVQVTFKPNAAVSTLTGFCQYYQSTSP